MPLGIQKELSDRAENTFQKIPSQRVNQNWLGGATLQFILQTETLESEWGGIDYNHAGTA
jgi:hypothetical protein